MFPRSADEGRGSNLAIDLTIDTFLSFSGKLEISEFSQKLPTKIEQILQIVKSYCKVMSFHFLRARNKFHTAKYMISTVLFFLKNCREIPTTVYQIEHKWQH